MESSNISAVLYQLDCIIQKEGISWFPTEAYSRHPESVMHKIEKSVHVQPFSNRRKTLESKNKYLKKSSKLLIIYLFTDFYTDYVYIDCYRIVLDLYMYGLYP